MNMDPFQLYRLVQWVGGLLLLGWIAALAWRWSARSAALRHELRMKVLERFSSEEFVAQLQTEGGREWMADILSGRAEPQELVDGSLRQAIVLTFLGVGLLGIARVVESRFLLASGILIVSGAAGLWVSTWVVARRRRSRREPEAS
jgi:hypothetical protein